MDFILTKSSPCQSGPQMGYWRKNLVTKTFDRATSEIQQCFNVFSYLSEIFAAGKVCVTCVVCVLLVSYSICNVYCIVYSLQVADLLTVVFISQYMSSL